MADRSEAPDPGAITAEEFARLVATWEDDSIITEGIRAVGVDRVLERILGEMCRRLRAEQAGDLDATVQWVVEVRGERHAYALHVRDGECTVESGEAPDPRVTFRLDLASFARLVTGQANPFSLLLTRRMRVSGDLLFARRVPRFFEMPRP